MRLLKIIFIAIYTIVGVELFFIFFNPRPMLPRYITAKPYGVRGNLGNIEYTHKSPDYKVSIRINGQGMRSDKEFEFEPRDSSKRVLLLGDSFGMGYGVNIENSFPERFRYHIRNEVQDIDILNLSSSGHGNAEELLTLKHEGLNYNPNLVLLQFHFTDYDDNERSKLFVYSHNKLNRLNNNYLPAVGIREKLFKSSLYRWFAGNYNTYNWLREEVAGAIKRLKPVKVANLKADGYIDTLAKENLCFGILDSINSLCLEKNVEFAILDVPMKLNNGKYKNSITPYLKSKLEASGITIINISDRFNAYPKELLYWERSHGHFTPKGCDIVGKEIAKVVSSKKILF